MPSIDTDASNDQFNNEQSKPMSGPIVGIIYPPPEVRSILLEKIKNIFITYKPIITHYNSHLTIYPHNA